MTKEALTLALEALKQSQQIIDEYMTECVTARQANNEAIIAIKEVLAQPAVAEQHKQEYQFGVYSAEDLDKAWKSGYDNCKAQSSWTLEDVKKAWKRGYTRAKKEQRQNRVGIYTTPPQRKPLTEQEIGAILEDTNAFGTRLYTFARAIEAKLKEKNSA